MTAEHTYNETIMAAHEADICQWLLDEMRFRGVTDHVALSVVTVRRDAADRRYREMDAQYRALTAVRER